MPVINIIKNSEFHFDNVYDWSAEKSIHLPMPTVCARVNFIVKHSLSEAQIQTYKDANNWPNVLMPTSKTANKQMKMEFWDMCGNYFCKDIICNAQGNSSMSYWQKNYSFDIADESEIKFDNWIAIDSFHLKCYYIDIFRGVCDVCYKYAEEVIKYTKCRPNRHHFTEATHLNGVGNKDNDFNQEALCHPDGFPVEVYINGEYHGLYAFNLKKHRSNYSMKKSDYSSVILDGQLGNDTIFNKVIDFTKFELKNPKSLLTTDIVSQAGFVYQKTTDADEIAAAQQTEYYQTTDNPKDWTATDLQTLFGNSSNYPAYAYRTSKDTWYKRVELMGYAFKAYNGDAPRQLLDDSHHYYDSKLKHYNESEVTERDGKFYVTATLDVEPVEGEPAVEPVEVEEKCVFDPSNKDHANTLITHNVLKRLSNAQSDIDSQATTDAKKEKFHEYFDLKALQVYFIISNLTYNNDGFYKNWIWVLYDNGIAAPTFYDMDSVFGRHWMGTHIYPTAHISMLGTSSPISKYCWSIFKQETKDLYADLRNKKYIDVDYIVSFLEKWVAQAGPDAYSRLLKKIKDIPSYRDGTQEYSRYPNNSAGTAATGTNGMYDTIDRVRKWLELRIAYLDEQFEYTQNQ